MDSQTHALPYVPLPSEHTMITKFEGSFIHVWKNLPIQKLLQSTIFFEDHTYAVDRRGKAEQG